MINLNKNTLFTEQDDEQIVKAIAKAEYMTSGEIRVHISKKKEKNSLDKTIEIFNQLKMYNTKDRNAVLIHISLSSKSFSIYGDKGIHERVGDAFWNDTKEKMVKYFKQGNLVEGIKEGVLNVGEKLHEFFPFNEDDVNELSNEITFD